MYSVLRSELHDQQGPVRVVFKVRVPAVLVAGHSKGS